MRNSPYSVQMRDNTNQKKLRIWILFTQCKFQIHIMLRKKEVIARDIQPKFQRRFSSGFETEIENETMRLPGRTYFV